MQQKLFIPIGGNTKNPFFYIIEHIITGKLYAGYYMRKNKCNSDTFMTPKGYQTSSRCVKELIASDGLDAFKIIRIRHFVNGCDAFMYECLFLRKVNAMINPIFLNKSNGYTGFRNIGGWKHSNATKNKMSISAKFRPPISEDTRNKQIEIQSGRNHWHNGNITKFCKECPGPEWTLGMFIPINKSLKGRVFWNNGIINKRSKECPGDGWVIGMFKTKK